MVAFWFDTLIAEFLHFSSTAQSVAKKRQAHSQLISFDHGVLLAALLLNSIFFGRQGYSILSRLPHLWRNPCTLFLYAGWLNRLACIEYVSTNLIFFVINAFLVESWRVANSITIIRPSRRQKSEEVLSFSLLVPCRNEAENIADLELACRLQQLRSSQL